jgi:tetratricopeptide (TPR) repeat protein
MLTPKKKISKREIKEDALLTAYAKSEAYYYNNKKYINYALTGLAVVVIGIVIFVNNRKASNEKAQLEFAKVFSIYDAGATDKRQYTAAIQGKPEQGIIGLKAIVDNYGSSEAGEVARLYLANAYLALGQVDDALKQYDDFGGSDPMLKASAVAGAGACYEMKKEYAKAGAQFEKAASVLSAGPNAPEYLNSAARCYGMAGEKEKAVALLKQIKKDFPKSPYALDADRFISQFSA